MRGKKIKKRVTWGFNPATRVVKSKKVYCRKHYRAKLRKLFDI